MSRACRARPRRIKNSRCNDRYFSTGRNDDIVRWNTSERETQERRDRRKITQRPTSERVRTDKKYVRCGPIMSRVSVNAGAYISASSSGTIIISIAFDRGYYQFESPPIRERISRKELSYGKIPLSWDLVRSFGRPEGNQFFNSSLPVGLPAQSNYAVFSKSVPEICTRRYGFFFFFFARTIPRSKAFSGRGAQNDTEHSFLTKQESAERLRIVMFY